MENPLKIEDGPIKDKAHRSFNIAYGAQKKLEIRDEDDWLNLEEACDRYVDRTMEGPNIALSNE